MSAIKFSAVVSKVLLPAVFSPIIAGLAALAATYIAYRITARGQRMHRPRFSADPDRVGLDGRAGSRPQRRAKNHGHHHPHADHRWHPAATAGPPFLVILCCGLAIGLDTSLGGWRITQTLGKRVSEIQSPQGFAAETSSAAAILSSAHLGIALSTTPVCTGSIFGAGAGRRLASVQWSVAGRWS